MSPLTDGISSHRRIVVLRLYTPSCTVLSDVWREGIQGGDPVDAKSLGVYSAGAVVYENQDTRLFLYTSPAYVDSDRLSHDQEVANGDIFPWRHSLYSLKIFGMQYMMHRAQGGLKFESQEDSPAPPPSPHYLGIMERLDHAPYFVVGLVVSIGRVISAKCFADFCLGKTGGLGRRLHISG